MDLVEPILQTEKPLESESWSDTDQKTVRFANKWIIRNFDFFLDKNHEEQPKIESPKFSPICNDKLKFFVSLYPKGQNNECKGYLSVFVNLFSSNYLKEDIRARFRISIYNENKIKINSFAGLNKFTPGGKGRGWTKYISHENLKEMKLLPDNNLTIYCEVEAIIETVSTTGKNEIGKQIETKVLDDLSLLLENAKLSDVVLVTENWPLTIGTTNHKAHKAILAARSSVFAAMFEHDTKESKENRVKIPDISCEIFKEFLKFIYSGKIPSNLSEIDNYLLVAADKYAVDQLKDVCEQSIIEQLDSENVVDMLVLADKHSAKQLRAKAIEYIDANLSEIMETEDWKAIEEQPKLYFELFSKLLKEKVKK